MHHRAKNIRKVLGANFFSYSFMGQRRFAVPIFSLLKVSNVLELTSKNVLPQTFVCHHFVGFFYTDLAVQNTHECPIEPKNFPPPNISGAHAVVFTKRDCAMYSTVPCTVAWQ